MRAISLATEFRLTKERKKMSRPKGVDPLVDQMLNDDIAAPALVEGLSRSLELWLEREAHYVIG